MIATFALAALATLAFLLRATVFKDGEIFTLEGTIMTFIGVSMVLLSLQKFKMWWRFHGSSLLMTY